MNMNMRVRDINICKEYEEILAREGRPPAPLRIRGQNYIKNRTTITLSDTAIRGLMELEKLFGSNMGLRGARGRYTSVLELIGNYQLRVVMRENSTDSNGLTCEDYREHGFQDGKKGALPSFEQKFGKRLRVYYESYMLGHNEGTLVKKQYKLDQDADADGLR